MRMREIAAALAAANQEVCLVTGGTQVGGQSKSYTTYQLPIVRTAPGDFSTLLDENLNIIDPEYKQGRIKILLENVKQFRPHCLLIESYPFGRKQLKDEIEAMLDMARHLPRRPFIACSIRDVLQQRSIKREQQTVTVLRQSFDRVLIHGDENWIPLGHSFSLVKHIDNMLDYTGYVVAKEQTITPANISEDEILVSAGGGAVSAALIHAAVSAGNQGPSAWRWRILVGKAVPDSEISEYQKNSSRHVVVERNRADFSMLLKRCAVSVSQAGYNTCMDVLNAGCRSVMVPYASDGETEQMQRATLLAKDGHCILLRENDLNPDSLLQSIKKAKLGTRKDAKKPDMDGSRNTAALLIKYAEKHQQQTL